MPRAPLRSLVLSACVLPAASIARAEDGPPPVPATRVDLKQVLEASKHNKPRLPLPPLSEADRAKMADAKWAGADWSVDNNGRTRKSYLPAELANLTSLRGDDPVMSLGHRFQTMLFWIVSRANNCTDCMGHQESKLAAVGMTDDQVAALDGDWSDFSPQERVAFALARKLTTDPALVEDADVAQLRAQFPDKEVVVIVFQVTEGAYFDRLTEAARLPLEAGR